MNHEEYENYLAGDHWQQVRRETFETTEGRCIRCGDLADDCHHTTYRSLGHEAPGDVIPVCERCHEFLSGKSKYDPARKVRMCDGCFEREGIYRCSYMSGELWFCEWCHRKKH